jgi:hypothetical protein
LKGSQGVARHIASAHPKINRQKHADSLSHLHPVSDEEDENFSQPSRRSMDELHSKFEALYSQFAIMVSEEPTSAAFSNLVNEFIQRMIDSTDFLPGPKNPS